MLSGSMEIRVVENDAMKYSRSIDENSLFGFREGIGEQRTDFCTATNN